MATRDCDSTYGAAGAAASAGVGVAAAAWACLACSSDNVFREAKPFSKSGPTMSSMLFTSVIALDMKLDLPDMVQVTLVPVGAVATVNSVVLVAAKGLMNSNLISARLP